MTSMEDARRIVREVVFDHHAIESDLAHMTGYVRAFRSPSIARHLAEAGGMLREPRRRAYDLRLTVFELIGNGTDSPAHAEALAVLAALSVETGGDPDDFRYLLSLFVVLPAYVVRVGGGRLAPREREAFARFFGDLGAELSIRCTPRSFAAMCDVLTHYERTRLRDTARGAALTAATLDAVGTYFPWPVRPWGERLVLALQPPVPGGSPRLGALDAHALRAVLRVATAVGANARDFVSGAPNSEHPHGYGISDLHP